MAGSPEYLTAVSLHFLEGERNYRLLFGNPVKITTKDHRYGETQEIAFFRPGLYSVSICGTATSTARRDGDLAEFYTVREHMLKGLPSRMLSPHFLHRLPGRLPNA